MQDPLTPVEAYERRRRYIVFGLIALALALYWLW